MKQALTLSDKQLKAVYLHCSTRRHADRDRAIIAVSFLTGMRAKEIASLTIDNILDDNGCIKDEFTLAKSQTKGQKAPRVFLNKKLKRELEAYLSKVKLRDGCAALFQSQKGRPFSPNTLCQLFLNIYTMSGIHGASSHSGRRTLLTNLATKGVSVRLLAEIAGHSSIAITQKYLDVNDEQIRKCIELA